MKITRYALMAVIAFATLSLPTGCETVKEGTDKSVSYVRGEYKREIAASLSRTVAATRKAIAKLKLKRYSDQADALSAKFVLSNAKDQDITIILEPADSSTTVVKIYIDAFGDKALAQTIYDSIRQSY